jgi:hypothetical protein
LHVAVLLTFQNVLEDLRGRPDMFTDDEQLPSKTAVGWYLQTLGNRDEVSWDLFWSQLTDTIKETSLDGARWRYILHQLHQDKQRLHFQQVVSSKSDACAKLAATDFARFCDLTGAPLSYMCIASLLSLRQFLCHCSQSQL